MFFSMTFHKKSSAVISGTSRLGLCICVMSASKTGGGLRIGPALTKTITFRIIVTSLGLTSNYFVLGDVATAVGPSSFALVVGPVLYLSRKHVELVRRRGPSFTEPGFLPPHRGNRTWLPCEALSTAELDAKDALCRRSDPAAP